MLKKLTSPWIGSILGLVVYLAVTAATWNAATANITADHAKADPVPVEGGEYKPWLFNNVEVDNLIKELREERDMLKKREQDLNELSARLEHERTELTQLTQAVHRMQKEFDQSVSRVTEEETANLKKIAKTYTAMEPEGAASIFKTMDDAAVVKIMVFMKEPETGPILAAMSKLGEGDAKRAGELTEKLRLAVAPKKK